MHNPNLLTSHHALLNGDRDSVLSARQARGNGDRNKGNDCFAFFGHQCPRTTTSTPKVATTPAKVATTVVRVSTTTTSKAASTVTSVVASVSVQQVTVTSKAVVTTTPTITGQPSSTTVLDDDSGSSAIFTSSSGGSSPSPSGMQDSRQGSNDGDSTHPSSSSFSLIKYLTTDENGYTIDATSTSFIQPLSTDSGLNGGNNTSNAKTNSTSAASKRANVGAIVGGIVGAITFILLLLFAIWTIRRRKKNRTAPSSEFIKSYRTPFGSGSDSRFRHLDDANYDADAQSISNFPFEPAPPHGTQESYRSHFHHTREKADIS